LYLYSCHWACLYPFLDESRRRGFQLADPRGPTGDKKKRMNPHHERSQGVPVIEGGQPARPQDAP
jgi:hypothetical protein